MSFQTKQLLDSSKFLQPTGATLNLSGETIVSGEFRYSSTGVTLTGNTQFTHKKYVDDLVEAVSAGTPSLYYTGITPSVITVGGITAGATLTGKTYTQLFQELLVPTLNPTLTAPSITSFTDDQAASQEVGVSVTPSFTTNFSRGSISPQYTSASPFRSGAPNLYRYNGPGNSRTVVSTSTSNSSAATGATVLVQGANSWTVNVRYDAGVQPKDSSGGNFSTPLASGTTSNSTVTVTGYFFRFFGPTASSPANSADVRALPSAVLQTSNVMTFTLNTGNVLTKFVVALPPGRTITSVFDTDAANANITASYVLTGTLSVNDGGGSGTARTYNIYELNLGAPYSSSHAHSITTA